jgi:tRNA(Ile)-lysidine synthase
MHPFEQQLAAAWPPERWADAGVLLAVSGGADSVALLRAIVRLKAAGAGRLTLAHFNHALRGRESHQDEQFVAELGRQFGLTVAVGRTSNTVSAAPDEATLRDERYAFFQVAAEQAGARYLAVAHTADDQAETILHRIVRGTGLAGLAGMRRFRPLGQAVTLVRPMLDCTRSDVAEYLAELGQSWREDRSNQELGYTRNRIRHELLPLLERGYNAGVRGALLRLGALAAQAQEVIEPHVESLVEHCVRFDPSGAVNVDCGPLAAEHAHLVRELFAAVWRRAGWPLGAMGFEQWDELAKLARSSDGGAAATFPGSILARRQGSRLTLRAAPAPAVPEAHQAHERAAAVSQVERGKGQGD